MQGIYCRVVYGIKSTCFILISTEHYKRFCELKAQMTHCLLTDEQNKKLFNE